MRFLRIWLQWTIAMFLSYHKLYLASMPKVKRTHQTHEKETLTKCGQWQISQTHSNFNVFHRIAPNGEASGHLFAPMSLLIQKNSFPSAPSQHYVIHYINLRHLLLPILTFSCVWRGCSFSYAAFFGINYQFFLFWLKKRKPHTFK